MIGFVNAIRVPSGDQLGLVSDRPCGVRPRGAAAPETSTTKSPVGPFWMRPYSSRVESGDQSGAVLSPPSVVSRRWPVPSAFITQISSAKIAVRFRQAIFEPSGDQAGSRLTVCPAESVVSRRWPVPSAFMT